MDQRQRPIDGEADEFTIPEPNVKARTDIIKECAALMIEIKEERVGLNERAADIRKRLKDNGILTKPFEFALRLAEMEKAARDEWEDGLQECYAALGIGEQLDWLDATAKADQG